MFCHKCGQEIRDGVTFCPKCGAPIKRRFETFQNQDIRNDDVDSKAESNVPLIHSSASAASQIEAEKPKKKGGLIVALICLLAIGAGAYYFFFGNKSKVDLNDYLVVTYEEYGHIDARAGLAVRKLMKDYAKVFSVTDKNKEQLKQYIRDVYPAVLGMVDVTIAADIGTAKIYYGEDRTEDEALVEVFLIAALADDEAPGGNRGLFPEDHYEPEMKKGKLDRDHDLKAGETINFTWGEIDSKKVEELFNVKLSWSSKSFSVQSQKEMTVSTEGSIASAEESSATVAETEKTTEIETSKNEEGTEASKTETKPEKTSAAETISYVTMYVVNCKESIALRKNPDAAASEISQIPFGEPVSFIETAKNGFFKIVYNGNTGYALAAYLSEEKPEPQEDHSSSSEKTDTKTIFFGHFDQDDNGNNGKEPIEWFVFVESDEYVWLISKYILAAATHTAVVENVTYENSIIRQYLNSSFLNLAFSEQEKAKLISLTVDANLNPDYPSVSAGKDVVDLVAVLSVYEVNKYFKTAESRMSYASDNAIHWGVFVAENGYSPWWTRTPGNDNTKMALVRSDGSINTEGRTGDTIFGIRPVICLKKSSLP